MHNREIRRGVLPEEPAVIPAIYAIFNNEELTDFGKSASTIR